MTSRSSPSERAAFAAAHAVQIAEADPDHHQGVPEQLRQLYKAGQFAECYELAQETTARRYIT